MTRVDALPLNQPIWFDLMTSDAESARAYYHAILGWEYDISGPEMGHYAVGMLDGAPTAGIGTIPEGAGFPPSWTVFFGVADADAAAKAVTGNGGTVMMGPESVADVGRYAIVQDPTGAVFGLWQPGIHTGAGLVGEHGGMAWCEVNSRDAEKAATFYAKIFGLRDQVLEMQGSPYHMLHAADQPVCGALQMTAEWGELPPHWMTYFAVRDIEAAKATVLKHGGQVPFGPFDSPYGKIIVTKDPQGAAVSFIELSPQE